MFRKLFLVLLFTPLAVFGQAAAISDQVTTSATNVPPGAQAPVYTVPNATVYICIAVTGQTCSTFASVYSDPALTLPISQPIQADGQGRYTVYVTPGTYFRVISDSQGVFLGAFPFTVGSSSSSVIDGSVVDVSDISFAIGPVQSCVGVDGNPTGVADRAGVYLSTCAARNAAAYASSLCLTTGGNIRCPTLYFPFGYYRLKSSTYTAVLTLTTPVGLAGDGQYASELENESPTASLISYQGVSRANMHDLALSGFGTGSTGTLLEIFNSSPFFLDHLYLTYNAGIGMNFQGSTEKGAIRDSFITNNARAILTEGDTNEIQFDSVHVEFDGQVNTACYDENCTNGVRSTGNQRPSGRAVVYLDGDNIHWSHGSIKSTCAAGIRVSEFDSEVSHTYFEGAANNTTPCFGYSIAAGGKIEIGHGLSTFTPSSTSLAVDDAVWQPLYTNDPALAASGLNGQHSYTPTYFLFPLDYSYTDCSQSAAIPALLKCQSAQIAMQDFAGDGNGYLVAGSSHAINGAVAPGTACTGSGLTCRGLISSAITWPANEYVVEQTPIGGYEPVLLSKDHINMIHPNGQTNYSCSDTATATSSWVGNPSNVCADIFAGYTADGYAIPFLSQNPPKYGNAVHLLDLGIANGGSEQDGHGWIKVGLNGRVVIDQGNGPLGSFTPYSTALSAYVNGNTEVQVFSGALAQIDDESAGYHMVPQNLTLSAKVLVNSNTGQAVSTENYEPSCTYTLTSAVTAIAPPTNRVCDGQRQIYYGGSWLNAPGNAQVTSEIGALGTANTITLPAASAGTPVKTGVYDANCNGGTTSYNLGNPISALNLALGYSSIMVTISGGFPTGVYYGLGQYNTGGATDANTGTTPNGWIVFFCNSDSSSHTLPQGTTAQLTQFTPGLLNF